MCRLQAAVGKYDFHKNVLCSHNGILIALYTNPPMVNDFIRPHSQINAARGMGTKTRITMDIQLLGKR